jgi:hypothetical protein
LTLISYQRIRNARKLRRCFTSLCLMPYGILQTPGCTSPHATLYQHQNFFIPLHLGLPKLHSIMIEAISPSHYCAISLRQVYVRFVGYITHYHGHGAPWNVHCHLLRRETAFTKHVPDSHQSDHIALTIETHALFPSLSRVSI